MALRFPPHSKKVSGLKQPDKRITLKFTGWKAVALLLVSLAVAGSLAARYFSPAATLPDSAQSAIKSALRFESRDLVT